MKWPTREPDLIQLLLTAYRMGAFPMADPESGEIDFFMADPRGIIPIGPGGEGVKISRSLARRLRSGWFTVTSDRDFEGVIRGCAEPRADDNLSWINESLISWCLALHRAGFAHSVETWRTDPRSGEQRLVGGIYGVAIGGAFFGESMFSRPLPRAASGERHPLDGTDASKVALVHMHRRLAEQGFILFDTQAWNPHIGRLGCIEISAVEYEERLHAAVALSTDWGGVGGAEAKESDGGKSIDRRSPV